MDIQKIIFLFYCTMLCAAEKSVQPVAKISYVAAARAGVNRYNGAGPAGNDEAMKEFHENELWAQGMAAREAIRREQMKSGLDCDDDEDEDDYDEDDYNEDDYNEKEVVPTVGCKRKYDDIDRPSHFITADGEEYEIPVRQWEQYSRGEITWEDMMDWMRALKTI